MKAKIQRDGCISCGMCAQTCPDVFRMAQDGLAEVFSDPVPPELEEQAVDAQENCPVSVITVESD